MFFVQLRENRKLKYALTFNVIGWANKDLNMTYCLSNEKVCYLGYYPGCLFIIQWNSEPEDHWSCTAHLSAEDMLKSAVIEEKKFKHSPWAKADNPSVPKFWCQHEGLITMVICCKFKKNLFNLWLYDLINVYSHRSGADNPRGQNFDVNRNLLSLRSFAKFQNNLFFFFFMILYMYIAPWQGLTTPWGRN